MAHEKKYSMKIARPVDTTSTITDRTTAKKKASNESS